MISVLLMKTQGSNRPKVTYLGSGWAGSNSRLSSHFQPSLSRPLWDNGVGVDSGVHQMNCPDGSLESVPLSSTHCPSPAIVGVSHLASLRIFFLPSQFTPHSGKETQLTVPFPGVKPFHCPQACFSHWPVSLTEEVAIFLE